MLTDYRLPTQQLYEENRQDEHGQAPDVPMGAWHVCSIAESRVRVKALLRRSLAPAASGQTDDAAAGLRLPTGFVLS